MDHNFHKNNQLMDGHSLKHLNNLIKFLILNIMDYKKTKQKNFQEIKNVQSIGN